MTRDGSKATLRTRRASSLLSVVVSQCGFGAAAAMDPADLSVRRVVNRSIGVVFL